MCSYCTICVTVVIHMFPNNAQTGRKNVQRVKIHELLPEKSTKMLLNSEYGPNNTNKFRPHLEPLVNVWNCFGLLVTQIWPDCHHFMQYVGCMWCEQDGWMDEMRPRSCVVRPSLGHRPLMNVQLESISVETGNASARPGGVTTHPTALTTATRTVDCGE